MEYKVANQVYWEKLQKNIYEVDCIALYFTVRKKAKKHFFEKFFKKCGHEGYCTTDIHTRRIAACVKTYTEYWLCLLKRAVRISNVSIAVL